MSQFKVSIETHALARDVFPHGVNSPLRLFSEVDTPPLTIASARGARMTDVDGKSYVDFITGLGAHILGHTPPEVVAAVVRQISAGSLFSCSHALEYELGREIILSTPAVQSLRFVCSGTEAVMGAIRAARAFTGKEKIIRFSGSYHGHADEVFYRGESAVADWREKGLIQEMAQYTLTAPYDSADEVEQLLRVDANIAAVIVEPVASNMGLKIPDIGFLTRLRAACDRADTLLIFDEVVSGFRFCYGGVTNLFSVQPDLIAFGKIIGGGLPAGCFGGNKEVMQVIERLPGYFHGGTFAANPLSCAAGLAALSQLRQPGFYEDLDRKGALFIDTLNADEDRQLTFDYERLGSLFSIWPRVNGGPAESQELWRKRFAYVHHELVKEGFLLPPSVDEPVFISSAHSDQDVVECARMMRRTVIKSLSSVV